MFAFLLKKNKKKANLKTQTYFKACVDLFQWQKSESCSYVQLKKSPPFICEFLITQTHNSLGQIRSHLSSPNQPNVDDIFFWLGELVTPTYSHFIIIYFVALFIANSMLSLGCDPLGVSKNGRWIEKSHILEVKSPSISTTSIFAKMQNSDFSFLPLAQIAPIRTTPTPQIIYPFIFPFSQNNCKPFLPIAQSTNFIGINFMS
jgi:hypothetical protein